MPRSRLTSICPSGAIRLVPTLMTTRIVIGLRAGDEFIFSSLPRTPAWRTRRTDSTDPAGRDNISILPLEWLSGKMKNPARLHIYACFQRHQALFRSRRKLYPVPAGISRGSFASSRKRLRTDARPRGGGHCLGYGDLDAQSAGEREPRLWSRTQRRDAAGR